MDALAPQYRRICLGALRTICEQQALLPGCIQITPDYDRSDHPQYQGGFADVWEGEYQGGKVAVKVLRMVLSDLDKIIKVFRCINPSKIVNGGVDRNCAAILQGSHNVEKPRAPKRPPVVGSNDERQVHNDIKVDGQREHQRIYQGE